ncbi:3-methyladenine DNA glycosylase [Flexivirga sp. ID2601S]|uniref:3-methyladenine DNA glycosylase n=1 Tax=Flexivirga aerilata TaxID=1656889 RepID=A0A849ARK7_9MICO|nr:3-methyladenine DNA glycosylase [Flexivirga aerilata]NNG39392.1 3-methyladenine DNA glycosylase [Flexivirga aerilata]
MADLQILAPGVWRPLARAHERRVDDLTCGHRERAAGGRAHPVEDFLFTYYSHRPRLLRRWPPGAGTALIEAPEHTGWKFYRSYDGAVSLDARAFLDARGSTVRFVRSLLASTAERPPSLGCFGLHEWAMVYRAQDIRHEAWPLRLGQDGTDEVVERHTVRCSHYDAFRFFTDDARPRNTLAPSRATQVADEQPGCLHAGMDLYKWAYKLTPALPSELVADCFELARDVRTLDMRASPYDLRELGYLPVPIETPEGKAEYVRQQRAFTDRGQALRARLISACDALLTSSAALPA